jgi:hypothetical protein
MSASLVPFSTNSQMHLSIDGAGDLISGRAILWTGTHPVKSTLRQVIIGLFHSSNRRKVFYIRLLLLLVKGRLACGEVG